MSKKRRNIIKAVGITIGIVIIAALLFSYLVIGRQVAEGLLTCNEGNDTKSNSIKQLELWGYNLEEFKSQYKENHFEVTASDGNIVPVTQYYQADDVENESKGSVILVHGHGGDYQSIAPLAELYLGQQYDVYAIDQRASGDSNNPYVSFGYFEKRDIEALVNYMKEEIQEDMIIVHGQSMGAATSALYAGTDHGRENLSALILDSSYDNMKHMFMGAMDLEGFVGEYFSLFGDLYLKLNYKFGFKDVDIIKTSKKIITPTFVIQCSKDELAPISVGESIYEGIDTEEKKYWLAESKHIEGLIDTPELYESQVVDFLEKLK